MQLDPKALGGMLWMMTEFDKSNNSKDRNVKDVTDKQKKGYCSQAKLEILLLQ